MGQSSCNHCKNTNCVFKYSRQYTVKVEQFNIQSGLNIYLEDMKVKGLYVVHHGHINEQYINKLGQKEICSTSKNGEIFAHKDFHASKHLFSAVAVEDSSICFIDKNNLLDVCKNNSELPLKLISFFSDELNKSDKTYKSFNYRKNG